MTNQKTVRDEDGNLTLIKRTNFQGTRGKNKPQKCQTKLYTRSYNEGNTNAHHKWLSDNSSVIEVTKEKKTQNSSW